jgi:hypothetical protein
MKECKVICTPNLTETLKSLEPGSYVHLGTTWTYGSIKQTASVLKIAIATKRGPKGITVYRTPEIPEPA